jgi:ATP-dependent RNA helicase SUPV3L1/SUV3
MTTSSGRVLAVLGPTNTGKTHFALDRMLGHATGMIGFPLRLLARENYDRIVRAKGAAAVALITGEEKIVPPRPRWFVCTVESMPLDRRVSFLAVDEIQLCADPDRGHVFTDRLLHARGAEETVFLGAETIKPLLRRLVPGVEFQTRPRLSSLTYAGQAKLNRLPSRSAVVAFSAAEVYATAEYVRRHKGGAAVVLGALSPRTRNAQVGMYQAGEVDFIVATDAIGMGLNMDVDHVAFAQTRKFDGRVPRGLEPQEVAQIAGRAGRHMNDGTFGTTADVPGLDPEVVEAVESHRFDTLRALSWRNSDLRFTSVEALLASLDKAPDLPGLIRAREADDHVALAHLALDSDLMAKANHPERVRLLWDVCQIPDFRKVMAENHTRLLAQIYKHLLGPGRRLPADWLANHVSRLDRVDGDIDTIVGRIAAIRTWTYVSHRPDWVADPVHWQETTRTVEDRLSDALHHCLTQRFVDRRTSVLVKAMQSDATLLSAVGKGGQVMVEGQHVGHLSGFCFVPDQAEGVPAAKAVLAAAARGLGPEIRNRVEELCRDGDESFLLGADGTVLWREQPVARLTAGPELLRPQVDPLASDLLEGAMRDRVRKRLTEWLSAHLKIAFRALETDAEGLSGPVRGLLHQLREGLGSCVLDPLHPPKAFDPRDRKELQRRGIHVGVGHVFVPALLKPAAQALRGRLWAAAHGGGAIAVPGAKVSLPAVGPDSFYDHVGYRVLDGIAVRTDKLDTLVGQLRALAAAQPEGFVLTGVQTAPLGLKPDDAARVVAALGYRRDKESWRRARAQKNRPSRGKPDSPFAVLRRI